MANPEKFERHIDDDGEVILYDENGMVWEPEVIAPQVYVQENESPSRAKVKIEIEAEFTIKELAGLLGGAALQNQMPFMQQQAQQYPQQTPQESYTQPTQEPQSPYSSQVYPSQFEKEVDELRFKRAGRTVPMQQQTSILATQPVHQVVEAVGDEPEQKKAEQKKKAKKIRGRTLPVLVTIAVGTGVIAGPIIHAYDEGQKSSIDCGVGIHPACATLAYFGDNFPNILNLKPAEAK